MPASPPPPDRHPTDNSPPYEPQEDSALLAAQVARLARGAVLDVGTGTGIQAITAARNEAVTLVVALDIDDTALALARKRHSHPKIHYLHSNLFSALAAPEASGTAASRPGASQFKEVLPQRFDIIICNPPYLPAEAHDAHPALYGGPHGWEFTIRLLREAPRHLAPGGQLLLIVSTLENKEYVLREAQRLGWQHEQLSEAAFFFERLSVHRLWRGTEERV